MCRNTALPTSVNESKNHSLKTSYELFAVIEANEKW